MSPELEFPVGIWEKLSSRWWLGVTRQSWPGEGNLGDATIVALPGS